MYITRLRTNHTVNPIGFDMKKIRLSYVVEESIGSRQTAAQVLLAKDKAFKQIVFDSGKTESCYDEKGCLVSGISGHCYAVPFRPQERTRYYWKVCVWTDAGEAVWSDTAFFETAKNPDSQWTADFITPEFEDNSHPVIFREIVAKKEVKKARAYVLGLGVYELYLNQEKAGEEYLLPGFHDYDSWLQYQTFELDIHKGSNLLEISLGDGWYKGPFGLKSREPRYGTEYAAIAEIYMDYMDGTTEVIGTDTSWQARKSTVTFDSIYNGEKVDAALDCSQVFGVKPIALNKKLLRPRLSPRILCHETFKPKVLVSPKGETILDFGQNMAGWVCFESELPEGCEVKLSYGEILQEGSFYRGNLRKALCEFTYISDGKKRLVRPHFTYYGFRYVKVEGWQGEVKPEAFTAWAIYSEMEERGTITTSNEKINRLFSNAKWGQKGNFLDVPTDCPQRDERMGWTGDAQVFADTACFNMDTYMFYEKFGQDMYFEQLKYEGAVPYVVPTSRYVLGGASFWGDAATIIPWQTYVQFGDITILEKQYNSMRGWVEYMKREDEAHGSRRLWLTGKHFGDWLALDGKVDGGVYGRTNCYYIASACYYYSAHILAKTAMILQKEADYIKYSVLAEEVKEAFVKEYFTGAGRLAIDTQTAYAIAIAFGLVPEQYKERVSADFRKKMMENNFALDTGFAGTSYLLPALSECGHADVAYELFLREAYPSWLYAVNMGATTIWERWNSVMPDGSMNPQGMNSLNHYAYGSVAAWMYRYMCGLNPVEEEPGCTKMRIHPYPSKKLQFAEASLHTNAGQWKVRWEYQGEKLILDVTVPFGCTAELDLTDCGVEQCTGDLSAEANDMPRDDASVVLYAGLHHFALKLKQADNAGWTVESDWRSALADEKAAEVLKEYFPRAYNHNIAFQDEMFTIRELIDSPFSEMYGEAITRLEEALKVIK